MLCAALCQLRPRRRAALPTQFASGSRRRFVLRFSCRAVLDALQQGRAVWEQQLSGSEIAGLLKWPVAALHAGAALMHVDVLPMHHLLCMTSLGFCMGTGDRANGNSLNPFSPSPFSKIGFKFGVF